MPVETAPIARDWHHPHGRRRPPFLDGRVGGDTHEVASKTPSHGRATAAARDGVSTVKTLTTFAILSVSFALRLTWGSTALADPQPPTRPPAQQDGAEAPAAGPATDVQGLIATAARRWNLEQGFNELVTDAA